MTSFLITDVRIFDGEEVIAEAGSVLVENGKITKVSTSSSISFDGPTYSKPGHTLLPGLIDAHIHANNGNTVALPQSLRFGVTTVCDLHNEYFNIQKLRQQIKGGDCADLKTTSYAATIENGWPMFVVLALHDSPEVREEISHWPKLTTPETGRQYVQDRVKESVDYIKLMHESGKFLGKTIDKPSLELQKAIITEAHAHGLKTIAHSTSLQDTLEILSCGVDGLAHTFIDQAPTTELIEAYKKNDAHCNPTLACMGSATTEGQAQQEKFAHDPRVRELLGEEERERMCACMSFAKASGGKVEHAYETVRRLKEAGVPVIIGSDSAAPAVGTAWGLSAHHELSLFVHECGFTPLEALRAATSLTASRFNFHDRGRIQEGLRADLMLVQGDPTREIDHTLDLRGVWTRGELCSVYRGRL
ncbi:hypothetical protein KC343_g2854 [Hortaea werneckii]|uniref:Amidohydrolase-related domain-containing protein n=1 Tax=Hortaea werneckii TaxID=91943 RepID=A0A3M7F3Y0_HORWE|nr:hypothetical protein KC323_g2144 [Hortaea werneckii]KAI7623729.1 hypothetical protein KC346_g2580 [Hortaea werneckii]KAI7633594.1 hypothetical protein KC343_g2854 [Hortaea werneckii]KAI7681335.1 hypothetical protein KC319_g1638 [Hortaea werneckii]KAI7714676.1 hypothetical protein KC322_g3112 [Hortaea werneckii]